VSFHESAVEEAALQWFESIGYVVAHGPDLLPDGTAPERDETTSGVGRAAALGTRVT
jgi:hypothetical protein